MKVLFICTGNTCRSAMAEGLANAMKKDDKNLMFLSAGIRAFPGMGAMKEAVTAIQEKADISQHKARILDKRFVQAADMIVTMTEDQKIKIQEEYPEFTGKLCTLKELAGEKGDVDDPYAHPQFVYDRCAKEIEELLEKSWHNFLE